MGKYNEFDKWRDRARDTMPALASRIFALRDVMYMGCGYHWHTERELGSCIAMLSDFDTGLYHHDDAAEANQIVLQVRVRCLHQEAAKAEASAKAMAAESEKREHAKTQRVREQPGHALSCVPGAGEGGEDSSSGCDALAEVPRPAPGG